MYTLNSVEHHSVCVGSKCLNPWDVQSKHIQPEDGVAESLYSGECRGGGGESYVMETGRPEPILNETITFSDTASARLADDGPKGVHSQMMRDPESNFVLEPMCVGNGQVAQTRLQNTVGTLNCMHDQQAVIIPKDVPALAIDRAAYNQGANAKYDFSVEEELAQPLVARGPGGVMQTQ